MDGGAARGDTGAVQQPVDPHEAARRMWRRRLWKA
jgi:hypothetical protein